jgi:hypothetical protein
VAACTGLFFVEGNHEVLQSGGLLGGGYLKVDGSRNWCEKRLMPRDLTKSNTLIKPGVFLGFQRTAYALG